tara:strand:- start:1091 stop:1876 length:786 start_codon:yes stop_codon:yes gene_type:complete
MIRRLLLAILILLLTSNLYADTGLMWQSVRKNNESCSWIKAFNKKTNPYLAFLWGSYGDDNRCLIKFMEKFPKARIRVYLSNGICIRKNNCSKLEATSTKAILKAACEAKALISSVCPECRQEIVYQLEDNYEGVKACKLARKYRKKVGGKIYRNPTFRTQLDPNCFDGYELHNDVMTLNNFVWSNDGKSLLLDDYQYNGLVMSVAELERQKAKLRRKDDVILWHAAGNCLYGSTETAPYPFKRTCQERPDIIKSLKKLMK